LALRTSPTDLLDRRSSSAEPSGHELEMADVANQGIEDCRPALHRITMLKKAAPE
jgi:hypothetical protein